MTRRDELQLLRLRVKTLEDVARKIFDDMVSHPEFDPYVSKTIPVSDSHLSMLAVALFSTEPKTG